MNLRSKLLIIIRALAFLAVVIAGVTIWSTVQWQRAEKETQDHYQRSLLLQRVRAITFRAFKEATDSVTGGDHDAREEFETIIKSNEEDFKAWAALATAGKERAELERVRGAYDKLVADARSVFDLVAAGRMAEAFEVLEGKLEDEGLAAFEALSAEAVENDRAYRNVVRAQTAGARRTAQITLGIAAFATVSLVLLLAAYLASDLFAPLREVEEALAAVQHGDLARRLPEERTDEFGRIGRVFNAMVGTLATRVQVASLTNPEDAPAAGAGWKTAPSRVTLHRLVAQLRTTIAQWREEKGDSSASGREAIAAQLDPLLQAVRQITDFGFPLDLNLARIDLRRLLYEVLLRFHDEYAARGVSFELTVAPEVHFGTVDRLKLREALGELVRNALNALPERGGRIGLRAFLEETRLIIEVADDGHGAEQSVIDAAMTRAESAHGLAVGLTLTKAIIEEHGGELKIRTEPGKGTHVRVSLPVRDA
jgi:two-component system, OmpR family, sensor kinase